MDDATIENFKDLDSDPVPKNEWGKYGNYELVGNGSVTSDVKHTKHICGQFLGHKGCLNVELHGHVSLDGVNHSGNAYIKKIFHSCDSPACPICFKHGWAVREASNIEYRIKECSKLFGQVEHIIASVPFSDYGLKFSTLKAKVIKILRNRGVIGGVIIFHAFRYCNPVEARARNQVKGWYFSPHFHILGFIDGGYGQCRHCKKSTFECLTCSGFEGRTRREYFKEGGKRTRGEGYSEKTSSSGSGYIVKVKGERITIHGTAWYQLNHSSYVRGSERAHIATWFGVCGYTKLKLKKEDRIRRDVCPICQHELEDVVYVGAPENDPSLTFWIKEWEEPFRDKDGMPNWIIKPKGSRYTS
jgi:hypothetical protein